MLSTKHDVAAVTRLALQFGLVSPYTSMVAIGDEVIVQGGTRRSVAVPVSVPAGMKWQAVKRETTVDTGSTKLEQEPRQEKKPKVGAKATEGAGTTAPTAQKPPEPGPVVLDGRNAEEEKAEPKKKQHAYRTEDEESDGEDEDLAPSTRDVATTSESGAEVIETSGSIASPGLFGPRLRLTTSFSGGFARAERSNRGLAALSMRVEYGRRFLVGVDSSLLLVGGDDVQGRVYLTASMRRVGSRYLELGIGQGVHFGAGAGLAVGASLRYHLPPAPRGAVFLRYDAAFLRVDDDRRTQQQLTLGVEWGF
jgi:hypothetical protein